MKQTGPAFSRHVRRGIDLDSLKGAKLDRAVIARVWRFVRAYHRKVYAFVLVTAASAGVAVLPPLVFRRLIDRAIPAGDLASINRLAALALGLSLAGAALGLLGSMIAVRVGEGLIFDLRTALYDHVQRMPIAFFTRTQTGALISRLNNDVVGAQQAVTGTLGSVVSSAITLGITIVAMLVLSWQITLLALFVLPLFLLPSKRVGRRLQRLSRDQMNLNAAMNATMQERF